MTARLEIQSSLFDEPFTVAETLHFNAIAVHLPDGMRLGARRTPAGVAIRLHLEGFVDFNEPGELRYGDEYDIAGEMAHTAATALRELLEKLESIQP